VPFSWHQQQLCREYAKPDRPVAHVCLSSQIPGRILHDVYSHQRTGRNQFPQWCRPSGDDRVAVTSWAEAVAQGCRQSRQFLWIQSKQAGLAAVETGIEIALKAETGFQTRFLSNKRCTREDATQQMPHVRIRLLETVTFSGCRQLCFFDHPITISLLHPTE
jgi:hypothetical protein